MLCGIKMNIINYDSSHQNTDRAVLPTYETATTANRPVASQNTVPHKPGMSVQEQSEAPEENACIGCLKAMGLLFIIVSFIGIVITVVYLDEQHRASKRLQSWQDGRSTQWSSCKRSTAECQEARHSIMIFTVSWRTTYSDAQYRYVTTYLSHKRSTSWHSYVGHDQAPQ